MLPFELTLITSEGFGVRLTLITSVGFGVRLTLITSEGFGVRLTKSINKCHHIPLSMHVIVYVYVHWICVRVLKY